MDTQAQSRARLAALFDQEIHAVEQVLDSLERERTALNARDADALLKITGEKERCVAQAAELERQRIGLQRELGVDGSSGEFDGSRHALRSLVLQCRELNDANGLMIRWQRQRVAESLNLVMGDRRDASVYGPDGEARAHLRQRPPIASA